jgi:hypothetical protein
MAAGKPARRTDRPTGTAPRQAKAINPVGAPPSTQVVFGWVQTQCTIHIAMKLSARLVASGT